MQIAAPVIEVTNLRRFAARTMQAILIAFCFSRGALGRLDMDRYARLREAERYQVDIAEKLFGEKKWKAARTEYEKFSALYKDSGSVPYCQYMVAECYRHEGLLNTAIKEFAKVIDFWPDGQDAPEAQYRIAECHWGMGDRQKAVEAWDKLIDKFPKAPLCIGALSFQAEYAFRNGQGEVGVRKLEQLIGNFARVQGWERLWDDAWNKLFEHYLYALEPDRALETARKRLDKDYAQLYTARRCLDAGRRMTASKDNVKKGESALKLALRLYADIIAGGENGRYYRHALGEVANVHQSLGHEKEADAAFNDYLAKFPMDDAYRLKYGNCLETQGKSDAAVEQYAKCEDKYRGRLEVAWMHRRAKKLDECMGVLEGIADEFKPRAAETYNHIEQVYEEFQKWDKAVETLKTIIQNWPEKSDDAYWRLGYLHHHRMGKPQEAIRFYSMSNKEPDSLMAIADCHARLKKWEEGVKTLSEVVGFFPDRAAEAQFRMAEYFAAWGKQDPAIKAYMTVCDKYPKSSWAQGAHDALELKYKIPYTGGGVGKKSD